MRLVSRREEVRWLREKYVTSQQRAYGLMQIAVSSLRYESRRSDGTLRERLVGAVRAQPRWGYRRLELLVRVSGMRVNHKWIFRVYREVGLPVKRRKRKRMVRVGSPRVPLTAASRDWALDFVYDGIASRRAICMLSVVDASTRECLALETDTGFASQGVTRVLE